MIRHRIAGEINGVPFRTSLFPDPHGGGCFFLVNRATQQALGLAPGSVATFTLWPDLEPRPATLCDALAALLDEEPGLRAWYDGLSESMRREIGKWIDGVRSEEARSRRALQMAERLLSAKEAEETLPPMLTKAFRAHPAAAQGWPLLTEHQRRQELLAIFYYQSPEARQRRVDKLCQLAAARLKAKVPGR